MRIRQMSGDENCLFHSISVALAVIVNGTHIDMEGVVWGVGWEGGGDYRWGLPVGSTRG